MPRLVLHWSGRFGPALALWADLIDGHIVSLAAI